MSDLKLCPFCSGPADYIGNETRGYRVECKHCGSQSGWGDYGYQVETNWNRRTSAGLEAKDALIAQLVEALTVVQPLFRHALDICDSEGIGPSEKDTDAAEELIATALSKAQSSPPESNE